MELTRLLACLAVALPVAYGAPTETAESLHPRILDAMKRDLGLDAEQAVSRVKRDIDASELIGQLQASAGASFAGAWIGEHDEKVNVAVTDETSAEKVTAAGGNPVIVSNTLSKLEQAQEALDNTDIEQASIMSTGETKSGIASYYVDVASNKLVIEALADSLDHAKELAKKVGLSESEFEIRTVEEMFTTSAINVYGGDAYIIGGNTRCSIGFNVGYGFVSAGHCGKTGDKVTYNNQAMGSFAGSTFPGSGDMAYIKVDTKTFNLMARINPWGGSDKNRLPVRGSKESAVGASICRSGSTTQVRCGKVTALKVTVNYSQGRVTGMTRTSACAAGGDSGGSFYTGDQAQGITSGASGNCEAGGTTVFQPINPVLSAYNVGLRKAA
ncbi:unnamed protein product [Clonostachys byssicola]|uniref:Peptidase S1A alpha-lytic prodomain domain-containing protein n=1 Tax=Clonostachys byssicola TaxID=160290 RepID=A0A9N9U6V2_9HYPO|nr:unnamed protein product [Clonostachys byssicola]